ncbi:hypothetical protein E4198_12820 [Streptomyces sp. RKND-216]|uniref:DUF6049 family protein n=1 Tax=Streptomyces sp. RKND-216 TaxID=2562581 RepID=UPI00109D8B22|nr:DUF6049 family protein [Streptomyces sp. RKND-216]THA25483.1 hypothetical protein E4198_12820 [Streptomyces sp. RKND-216]
MAEAAEKQHTQTAPTTRRLRRAAVAVLTAAPLLGGLPPAAAAAPQPATAPVAAPGDATRAPAAPQDGGTVEVELTELTPAVPDEDDILTISGTVTNNGRSRITEGVVDLRVGATLDSRSAMNQAAERTGFTPGVDPAALDDHAAKVPTLAPGVTRPFTLEVPVGDLGLESSGIHELGVSYSGHTPSQPFEQVLGIQRTFLPWQTSEMDKRTRFTYLWPLISSSHLTARTEADEQQTPIFRSDDLEEAIAPGGRLQQMVQLGKDLPVTWVVDPDLLASVHAMTQPYEVRTGEGKTKPGRAQATARQWLSDLTQAVEEDEVVALPFADPDVASLAHRGQAVPDALSRLRSATTLAQKTVGNILYTDFSTDFAWPVEGAVDTSVVDVATSAGADHVIASSESFSDTRNLPYTPAAARPIGGGTTAVVADQGLSEAFEGDLTHAGASTLAVQKFVAHTLAIGMQVPGKQRSVLVAPQRRPTVSQARAMAEAIEALDTHDRWAQSADLTETANARPDASADRSVPRPGGYPDRLRENELPTEAFRQIHSTQGTLEDFLDILAEPDRLRAPVGTATDRALSTSWRGHPGAARDYRESVQDYLVGLTGQIELIDKSDLTLSGRSATLPVTVQNNLAQKVDGLTLHLTSSRSIGLRIEDRMQPVVVDGGHSQSIKFDTTAKANGRTTVTAQLFTKDGKPWGEPVSFQVKVTSITSTVLLVIAAGVGLVVLAGIRMYTQRKRRGPAADPDAPLPEPSGDDEPSHSHENPETHGTQAPDDAEQAGEREQDTRKTDAGNGGRTGTGEKVDR